MEATFDSDSRLRRWQEFTGWPLIVLSFAYIASYTAPIYFHPLQRLLVTTQRDKC